MTYKITNKYKIEDAKEITKTLLGDNEKVSTDGADMNANLISSKMTERCKSCQISHFPHPKFCRWSNIRRQERLNEEKLIDYPSNQSPIAFPDPGPSIRHSH